MTTEVEVNGGEVSSPKDLSNGHANADGSYVFVNGDDVASDDPVETDLNSDSHSTVELTNKQSKTHRLNDDEEKIEASDVQESLITVTEGDVDQENEPSESHSGDQGVNVDCNLGADAELGMQSVNDQAQDSAVVNKLVDSDDGASQLNESSERTEILPSPVHHVADLPVADPPGDIQLETLVASGHTQETVVDDLVYASQETPQLNNTSEIALPSPIDSESVPVESIQSLPHTPVSISETTEPDVGLGASKVAENHPSSEAETEKLDMAGSEASDSHPVDNTIVHNEVENGSVGTDIVLNYDARAETETGIASMESEEKVLTLTRDDSNLKSKVLECVERKAETSVGTDIVLSCDAGAETETGIAFMESEEKVSTLTSDNSNLKSKVLEGVTECVERKAETSDGIDIVLSCDARAETETGIAFMESEEKVSTLTSDDSNLKSKVLEGVTECVERKAETSVGADIVLSCDARAETETGIASMESEEKVSTLTSDDSNLKSKFSEGEPIPVDPIEETECVDSQPIPIEDAIECVDSQPIPVEDAALESSISGSEEKESSLPTGTGADADVKAASEIENIPVGDVSESEVRLSCVPDVGHVESSTSSVEKESSLSTCPGVDLETGSENVVDVETASENENRSVVSCTDMPVGNTVVSEVLNGSVISSQSALSCVPDDVHVENGGIQFTDDDKTCQVEEKGEIEFSEESVDKTPQEEEENEGIQLTSGESGDKACQEVESIDGNHRDETLTSSPESSMVDASEMQNVGVEVVKRPFYFLVKVPRNDDENLKEQIKSAQSKVDEKTQSRDVIRAEIQTIRDTYKTYGDNLEAIMAEEKAARELLKSKRQEIDSLQSMINKVKNAISVEDIDGRIRNMEHMIAHETLPLKEEKQFIRDIKQLKQLREQFSSSMGKQDEVQQALDQKDQIEDRLKLLRKEAESLRENVVKAEAATQAAKKKQKDESEKLRKLYSEFKLADEIRQEAYKHLQSLKKQAYDKNKHFWKYKDDVKQANDLLSKGDKEALQHLCVNQVERVLELWNDNNEFRKEYVNCNIRSTLRRLKTMDGRSLGPDEEPPVIRSFVNNRVTKDNSVSHISTLKEVKSEQVVPVKSEKVDDRPIPIVAEQKNQTAKFKRPAKPAHSVNTLETVSGRDEVEEARDEMSKRTKEEEELARKAEELARKAEELRKKEEAAKLKEQRRLEEKVKAKEALERKKKIAEKAQARAVLRAQKEAEQKEKEREKRARKKEKRKAGAAEDSDLLTEGDPSPSTETPVESQESSEIREKSMPVSKKPQKSSQFTKQTKAKSIPLPLRNRGKRRMQTWMWALITALVVVALFLLGNSSFPSKYGLQWYGF